MGVKPDPDTITFSPFFSPVAGRTTRTRELAVLALGVTLFDIAERTPAPFLLKATTLKLYEVPFLRPVTVHTSVRVAQVRPAGVDDTTYLVITEPPVLAGLVHVTRARVLTALA